MQILKNTLLFSLVCCFYIVNIFCEKILVNIDRVVGELDTAVLCSSSPWAYPLSNACKCCLFKRIPQIGSEPGQKKAQDIVKECIDKNYCTQQLIDLLQGSTDLETALFQFYNTSVVIKKITKQGIAFDNKGNLTEQGAKNLLEKAYHEGKLPYEDFKSVNCIKAQDIFAEKKGLVTAQLFLVNSECSDKPRSYILKEMGKKYGEARQLADFFGLKMLDDLIWPNHIKDYPSLAVPLAFFQYDNHYLSLSPRADGQELDRFIVNYFLNPTQENRRDVEQAYFDLGYTMAKFHQRFMKKQNGVLGLTVVHGDLHHKNIFYDTTTRQVILIDNENMPGSFKNPQPVFTDLVYPILSPGMTDLIIPKEILHKVPPASWVELVAAPFLKGYVSGYPKKDWPVLFDELVRGIKAYKWTTINMYNKFKNVMDKQFETVKKYIQENQAELTNSYLSLQKLTKLEFSLSNLANLLFITQYA